MSNPRVYIYGGGEKAFKIINFNVIKTFKHKLTSSFYFNITRGLYFNINIMKL